MLDARSAREDRAGPFAAAGAAMDIYFLRHASAGTYKLPEKEDEKRPLDDEGTQQSRDIGRLLARLEVKPDSFISSPLTRAMQTAELVAKEIHFTADIGVSDALRPDAGYEQFQRLLEDYSRAKSIIVTGHNPTLSQFLSRLISHDAADDVVDLKKGAVAKVERSDTAQLTWCVTPRIARG